MLGILLKPPVYGPLGPQKRITDFSRPVKGHWWPGAATPETLQLLRGISPLQHTFVCANFLDRCALKHRPERLVFLPQVL